MAFAFVNPLTALWEEQGLSCLLMPETVNVLDVRQAAFDQLQKQQGSTAAVPNRPDAAAQRQRQRAGHSPGQSSHRRPAAQKTAKAGGSPVAAAGGWNPLPAHLWPGPWQERLAQTRPGVILWTYYDLGADICNDQTPGRQERSAFLRQLLRDLGHPAGTHTFWPVCLPSAGTATADATTPESTGGSASNADIFWSGVRCLKARGVVVMGPAAAAAAGLRDEPRPPQQLVYHGHLVWLLWDIDVLLHFDQRYASMLAFLRHAFMPVLR
ncbi:MAG: hypothetical protein IJU65_03420 [Desulfovibrio sp.]|nr:hypothetical protein [Desulfovibrio sp.]